MSDECMSVVHDFYHQMVKFRFFVFFLFLRMEASCWRFLSGRIYLKQNNSLKKQHLLLRWFYGHVYKPCILSLNIPQTPRMFSHCLCSPSSLPTPVSSRHKVIRRRWFPLVSVAPQLETEDEYQMVGPGQRYCAFKKITVFWGKQTFNSVTIQCV